MPEDVPPAPEPPAVDWRGLWLQAKTRARPLLASPYSRRAVEELGRAWPYALVLAASLGALLWLGVNMSNAFPSADRPFGWPGTANLENGVAIVRGQLVVAASLPGLLLGLRALQRLEPGRESLRHVGVVLGVDVLLVWAAVWTGGSIGAEAASKVPGDSLAAFVVAHGLLACVFWALAVLASVLYRARPAPPAIAVWTGYLLFYEAIVRWRLFRTIGYHRLNAGDFPTWFFYAQAFSPLAAYRALLILWRPGFRDYEEHAVLDDAAMPAWMTPQSFAMILILFWILIPLWVAVVVWEFRTWSVRQAERLRRAPEAPAEPAWPPSQPG